jgi:hypothetical protein
MEREAIKNLSEKNIYFENLDSVKNILENNYFISYGKYEATELKKAITEKNPFYIDNGKFIIGYDPAKDSFISDKNEDIKIERMIKAVIVEDIKSAEEIELEPKEKTGDLFVIKGNIEWSDINQFDTIFNDLRVGEIFLPPHSVIFNFLIQTEEQKKQKIVSMVSGININIYSPANYVDNCFHEIGHIFWRDCLKLDEKQLFKKHFDFLKPSAIYEYDWEKSSEEEVFCTVYKWYLKSMLLNKSFYNILEYEEPEGLKLLQNIMDRIAKDTLINDVWKLKKDALIKYLNPPIDRNTGKRFIKEGLFDEIKDIELPNDVLNNVDRFQDGIIFVKLNKAVVPVKGNRIDWEKYLNKDK